MKHSVALVFFLLFFQAACVYAYPVSGLMPYQRPEGAPVISSPIDAPKMQERLVQGISKPVPESIQVWVKDQGGWFNPFSRPGMPGRYDLRGWHSDKSSKP